MKLPKMTAHNSTEPATHSYITCHHALPANSITSAAAAAAADVIYLVTTPDEPSAKTLCDINTPPNRVACIKIGDATTASIRDRYKTYKTHNPSVTMWGYYQSNANPLKPGKHGTQLKNEVLKVLTNLDQQGRREWYCGDVNEVRAIVEQWIPNATPVQ